MALKVNNDVPIVIGLEDESGVQVPVKIDEPCNEPGMIDSFFKDKRNIAVKCRLVVYFFI